eukprot:1135-Heterococcus_DN1.PRE.11
MGALAPRPMQCNVFALMWCLAVLPAVAVIIAVQPVDQMQSPCGAKAFSFQVAVKTVSEWTSDMSVCYWTEFCVLGHNAETKAPSTMASCVAEPSGTFELDVSDCSSVQVHAALIRRDSNVDILMSEIAKVVMSPNCESKDLPLCTGDAHVQGAWVPSEPTAKAFICCGWDKDDYLNLPQHCGTPSTEIGCKDSKTDGCSSDPPYFTHVGGRGCVCDAEQGRFTINRREQYTWVPHDCRLVDWDALNFCMKLGTHNVIFIGLG